MARTRGLVAAGALVAMVAAPGVASAAPPPVEGSWRLTFTPATVRVVGRPIPRDDANSCPDACHASYHFTKAGAGDGRTTNLVLRFDTAGCESAPCDLRAVRSAAAQTGFTAPIHWDGTTFTGTGEGFFSGSADCADFLPKGTDTIRFTVDGPESDPRLTGELTALLSTVVLGSSDGCAKPDGYELYTGTFTGVPLGFRAPSRGPGTVPGAAPGIAVSGAAARALRADAVAARDHTRPVLSTRVATARDLPWRPSRVLVSALLALLLVALMPFPAALFNNTLEANYAEVSGWFAFLRRRPPGEPPPERGVRDFLLMVGAVSLLGAFLDPGLGFDRASLVLVVGLALSVAAVSLLSSAPSRLYVRRRYGERARVDLYPLGLALAAFCVVVSRLTSFEPGYLYGVVAGFGFARELARGEKGRLTVAASALLLVAAGAAFALRLPVHDAVVRDGGLLLGLLDTVLAAVFAAGVEANVIGLLPVRFMPGDAVYAWSRPAWAAAFGLSVFAFLHALSAAAGGATTGASVATAAALFLAFGAVSVAFWAYFRRRPRPAAGVEAQPLPPEITSDGDP